MLNGTECNCKSHELRTVVNRNKTRTVRLRYARPCLRRKPGHWILGAAIYKLGGDSATVGVVDSLPVPLKIHKLPKKNARRRGWRRGSDGGDCNSNLGVIEQGIAKHPIGACADFVGN